MPASRYRGRFAPSPTGPLHFGSLVTALASYLEALVHDGQWLVRIDDLDQTRQVKGMDSVILNTLEAFGFEWQGPVTYQSQSTPAYQKALRKLRSSGFTYVCRCSRSQIRRSARIGLEGPVYPDTCRDLDLSETEHTAIRLRTNDQTVRFHDGVFGEQVQQVHRDVGDFVIRRADGYFAYQLAVVIDDSLAEITHVVRGADLLLSTARQIYLQQLLGFAQPSYLHVPLVLDSRGRKLSKRDSAHPVDDASPVISLLDAWLFLNQAPPYMAADLTLPDFWAWAAAHWEPALMTARKGAIS